MKISQKIKDDIDMFWIFPIGIGKLDIKLRNMCNKTVWHRILWHDIYLIFFKFLGKFKMLGKKYQKYYESVEEYNKQ